MHDLRPKDALESLYEEDRLATNAFPVAAPKKKSRRLLKWFLAASTAFALHQGLDEGRLVSRYEPSQPIVYQSQSVYPDLNKKSLQKGFGSCLEKIGYFLSPKEAEAVAARGMMIIAWNPPTCPPENYDFFEITAEHTYSPYGNQLRAYNIRVPKNRNHWNLIVLGTVSGSKVYVEPGGLYDISIKSCKYYIDANGVRRVEKSPDSPNHPTGVGAYIANIFRGPGSENVINGDDFTFFKAVYNGWINDERRYFADLDNNRKVDANDLSLFWYYYRPANGWTQPNPLGTVYCTCTPEACPEGGGCD